MMAFQRNPFDPHDININLQNNLLPPSFSQQIEQVAIDPSTRLNYLTLGKSDDELLDALHKNSVKKHHLNTKNNEDDDIEEEENEDVAK